MTTLLNKLKETAETVKTALEGDKEHLKTDSFLTRDQILLVNDIKTEEVYVPEWGGKVLVRGMTGNERDRYETSLYDQRGGLKKIKLTLEQIKARLVSYSIVDSTTGKRLFSEKDIETLGTKSAKALNRIADVARRLSGITDEDMEELEKNVEETPGGDSATD